MTMPRHRRRLLRRTLLILVAGPLLVWTAAVAAPPALAANVVNVTIHTPADVQTSPCSPGDIVNLNGDLHIVITTTANGRNRYQVKSHLNAHLSGVSITTGTRYVSNESQNDQWSAGPSFPAVHLDTYAIVLVSQGGTPNYVLQVTVRQTIDATGAVVVTTEQWSMSCRGRG
jgi:hypothetical protein